MRRMGVRTILLSGDLQIVTTCVERELGVDGMLGELLPDQKANWTADRGRSRHRIAARGDLNVRNRDGRNFPGWRNPRGRDRGGFWPAPVLLWVPHTAGALESCAALRHCEGYVGAVR